MQFFSLKIPTMVTSSADSRPLRIRRGGMLNPPPAVAESGCRPIVGTTHRGRPPSNPLLFLFFGRPRWVVPTSCRFRHIIARRNCSNMRRRRRPAMSLPRVAEGGEPCLTAGERSVTRGLCAAPSNRRRRRRTAPTRHYISCILSAIRGLCMAGCRRVTHGGLLAATRYRTALVRPRWGRLIERLRHPRVTLADTRSPAVKHSSPPSATHAGGVSPFGEIG